MTIERIGIILGIGASIATILGLFYNYYNDKMKFYKNEISSIKSNICIENNKQYYDILKVIIDKSDLNSLDNNYKPISNNLVYFNDKFIDNNWPFMRITVKDFNLNYFNNIPTNIDKYKLDDILFFWKGSIEHKSIKSDKYKAFITLKVETKKDIEEYFKKKYPKINNELLSFKVEHYLNNFVEAMIVENILKTSQLNSNDKRTQIVCKDNIAYINQFVQNKEFMFFVQVIIIKINDSLIIIDAKVPTKNGISIDNEYFIKWLNNLKIVK